MNQLREAANAGAVQALNEYGPPTEDEILDHVHGLVKLNHPEHPNNRPGPNTSIGQAIIQSYLAAEQYRTDNDPDMASELVRERAVEVGINSGIRRLAS